MNLSFVPPSVLRLAALCMILSISASVLGALPTDQHPFGLDDYSALHQAPRLSLSRRKDYFVRGLTRWRQRPYEE